MSRTEDIEIRQVANGYIVMPTQRFNRADSVAANDEVRVFQTFAELVQWLQFHFTIRAKNIRWD